MTKLQTEIEYAINRASAENGSDTPDFILAEYLTDCLAAYDRALVAREKWYGRECGGLKGPIPADGPPPPDSENDQDRTRSEGSERNGVDVNRLVRPDGRNWDDYPVGTLAYNIAGIPFERVNNGWKSRLGDIFPRPSVDESTDCLLLPNTK